MAKKLKKLRIAEVSGVDHGAGVGTRVVLRKRDTGERVAIPAVIDSLPAILAAAPGWGYEIEGEQTKMK